MRILHFADVHLDRPFVRADRRAGERDRRRLREAFKRCLDLARKHEADAVTIGGDLWEDEHVSADTRRFVADQLAHLDVPVLMICGNHDPLLPGGNYDRTDWPDNVVLFREPEPTEHRLGDECSVWGLSWTHLDPNADFLSTRVVPDDGRTHLLLLHGTSNRNPDWAEGAHCPFDPARVEAAGFALCLAGHIHAACYDHPVVYPGSPEPLGWGEQGRHCTALITLGDGAPAVELIDVNDHSYEQVEVDCGGAEHGEEVVERARAALAEREGEDRHVRAVLRGALSEDCRLDPEHVRESLESRFAELQVVDETHRAYDLDALEEQPSATGHFVRLMRERLEAETGEGERRLLELALRAGLDALHGRRDIIHAD